ncbi:MAG TPA: DUF4124 domain-containing protein [Burkholderiales bacterium]|nr:DUF4124 domain-containing protein [Burkholderiales bacterium]
MKMLKSLALLALAFAVAPAGATVYECVNAEGHVLLTDSPCPTGYQSNVVVPEPSKGAAALPADSGAQASRDAEARARAAEEEAARLRRQLEDERLKDLGERARVQALDEKLDALLERQDYDYGYGGAVLIGPPIVGFDGSFASCGGGFGHRDCRAHSGKDFLHHKGFLHHKERRFEPRPFSLSGGCGIFGCTPTITHSPFDDRRPLHRFR